MSLGCATLIQSTIFIEKRVRRPMSRIYMSPPDMTSVERQLLIDAFDGGWVAPVGPDLDAFEAEFCSTLGLDHAVALASGTAGLHLALIIAGVGVGDEVLVPTLTFAATANAVSYVGAKPVMVDCDPLTWNIDPNLVLEELEAADREGRRIAAVITVDLYGRVADHEAIIKACDERDILVIEDAAEAVGSSREGVSAGAHGAIGVFSFNGNKLLTTGGGGMLVSSDEAMVKRARYLATQAREPVAHYEHRAVGYNYRMPNLSAALGRGQLRRLDQMLSRRREINQRYRDELVGLEGVAMAPADPATTENHWLSVITLENASTDRDGLIAALEAVDAEARAAWKPMHLQPVWAGARTIGGTVSEFAFNHGVCLPSGSSMTDAELDLVVATAVAALTGR